MARNLDGLASSEPSYLENSFLVSMADITAERIGGIGGID